MWHPFRWKFKASLKQFESNLSQQYLFETFAQIHSYDKENDKNRDQEV